MCRGIITYRLNTLRQIADGVILSDDDIALLRQAIRKLKLWVTPRDAPVDDIVQTGIVPRLVQLFNVDDFPDRFEALLILGYLTRSGNTTLLINSNVLPLFLGHLHSDRDREEQRLLAVWALGNIAKYPQGLAHVLDSSFMEFILSQFNGQSSSEMIRLAAHTLVNLCKGNLKPEQTNAALPLLLRLLTSNEYVDVYPCALKAIFHLTVEIDNETVQKVTALGFIPLLTRFLSNERLVNHYASLSTFHNIMLAPDTPYLQMVIDHQLLPIFDALLRRTKNIHVKKKMCEIVELISRVDTDMVKQSGILEPVIALLGSNDTKVTEYALGVICPVIMTCVYQDLRVLLVDQGCMDLLCNLITSPKSHMVSALAIYAVQDILDLEKKAGAGDDFYKRMIINLGVFREISKVVCAGAIKDKSLATIASNFVLSYAP